MLKKYISLLLSVICLTGASVSTNAADSTISSLTNKSTSYSLNFDECISKYKISIIPASFSVPTHILEETYSYAPTFEKSFYSESQQKLSTRSAVKQLTSEDIFKLMVFTSTKDEAIDFFESYEGRTVYAEYKDEGFAIGTVPEPISPRAKINTDNNRKISPAPDKDDYRYTETLVDTYSRTSGNYKNKWTFRGTFECLAYSDYWYPEITFVGGTLNTTRYSTYNQFTITNKKISPNKGKKISGQDVFSMTATCNFDYNKGSAYFGNATLSVTEEPA